MRRRGHGRGNGSFIGRFFKYIITLAVVAVIILTTAYACTNHGDEVGKKYDNAWDKAVGKVNDFIDRDHQPEVDKFNEKGSEVEDGIRSGKYKSQLDNSLGKMKPGDKQDVDFTPAMDKLKNNIAKESPQKGYSRRQFMKNGSWNKVSDKNSVGWEDFKPRNCSVRQAVVLTTGEKVKTGKNRCKAESGKWVDPYGTGKSTTNSSTFDLDHIVALSNAWKSGASKLDVDTRNKIANDRDNLILSDSAANRSKGDQRIDEWTPKKNSPSYCGYALKYATIKARYNLTVTQSEYDKLQSISQECHN